MKYCPACDQVFPTEVERCPEHKLILHGISGLDDTLAAKADPLIGATLEGRYEIKRLIGKGGMGSVYAALQLSTSREVAIKMITAGDDKDGSFRKRFLREAYLMSQLTNPHTVTVFDFGQTAEEQLFIAMELLKGVSLDELLAKTERLEPHRIIRLLLQICTSLAEAHSKGIIHRDIKPENIFVTSPNTDHEFVKVLDFGIARNMADHDQTRITKTGFINGTPQYMAPEVALGKPPAPTGDIYAVGVVFFQLLTGQPPYSGDSMTEILMAHCNRPIPKVSSAADSETSAHIQSLIDDMLAKTTSRRIHSVDELRRRLNALTSLPLDGVRFKPNASGSIEDELGPTDELGLKSLLDVVSPATPPDRLPPTAKLKELEETTSLRATDPSDRQEAFSKERLMLLLGGALMGAILLLGFNALTTPHDEPDPKRQHESTNEHFRQGKSLLERHLYPRAIKVLNEALVSEPDHDRVQETLNDALQQYVRFLVQNNRQEEAIEVLTEQEKLSPLNETVRTQLPALYARRTIASALKAHGSRSRRIHRELEENLFSRYPQNPV
ncbi:MAG: protein kinase domain-containing protein, partial [Bradymonadia bacterium]